MASLKRNGGTGPWLISFRYEGAQYTRSCKTKIRKESEIVLHRVENAIRNLESGYLFVPDDVLNAGDFIMNGGQAIKKPTPPPSASPPAEELVSLYLAKRTRDAKGGQLSLGTVSCDTNRLDPFLKFCESKKKSSGTVCFSFAFLISYSDFLRDRLAKQELGAATVKRRLHTLQMCAEWLESRDLIPELPAKLWRGWCEMRLPEPSPKFYSVGEVQSLYAAADESMKLWILLAVNCGYYSSDIASLEHGDVNFETGVVDRYREKQQRTKSLAVHRLWPLSLKKLIVHMTYPA